MLVRKGNAFYEIDEECMKQKGWKLPKEEEEVFPETDFQEEVKKQQRSEKKPR